MQLAATLRNEERTSRGCWPRFVFLNELVFGFFFVCFGLFGGFFLGGGLFCFALI